MRKWRTTSGAAIVAVAVLAGCRVPETPDHLRIPGADPERGRLLVAALGCGTCHGIEGIPDANGMVGPRLDDFASRKLLAGLVPNVPRYLVPWLIDPPSIDPDTAMPNVGLGPGDARDVAAFLYTLGGAGLEVYPTRALPASAQPAVTRAQDELDRRRLEGTWPGPTGAPTIPIYRAMDILIERSRSLAPSVEERDVRPGAQSRGDPEDPKSHQP